MKWLIPILAMLLLVGCSCNKTIPPPVSDQSEITVRTERQGTIFHQRDRRGVMLPLVPPQRQPELQLQPTKDEQVPIQQRKIKGYRAKIDSATGKITTYPVYEDQKR